MKRSSSVLGARAGLLGAESCWDRGKWSPAGCVPFLWGGGVPASPWPRLTGGPPRGSLSPTPVFCVVAGLALAWFGGRGIGQPTPIPLGNGPSAYRLFLSQPPCLLVWRLQVPPGYKLRFPAFLPPSVLTRTNSSTVLKFAVHWSRFMTLRICSPLWVWEVSYRSQVCSTNTDPCCWNTAVFSIGFKNGEVYVCCQLLVK